MNNQQIVELVLNSWYGSIKKVDALLEELTEEDFLKEVAPNRNKGIYILGHLTAINDMLFPLLDFGEPFYPELKQHFFKTPDNPDALPFNLVELQQYWSKINNELHKHFDKLDTGEWLKKHSAVSSEDFVKEPHRNKLNVILGRTNHMNYHLGQLSFLKSK